MTYRRSILVKKNRRSIPFIPHLRPTHAWLIIATGITLYIATSPLDLSGPPRYAISLAQLSAVITLILQFSQWRWITPPDLLWLDHVAKALSCQLLLVTTIAASYLLGRHLTSGSIPEYLLTATGDTIYLFCTLCFLYHLVSAFRSTKKLTA